MPPFYSTCLPGASVVELSPFLLSHFAEGIAGVPFVVLAELLDGSKGVFDWGYSG